MQPEPPRSRWARERGQGMMAGVSSRVIPREVELPVLLDADAITNLAGTDVLAQQGEPARVPNPARRRVGTSAPIWGEASVRPQARFSP